MDIEEIHSRVREAQEMASTTLNWIEEPTSDAPAAVIAAHLADFLNELEMDLMSDILSRRRAPADEMKCDRCGNYHGIIWFAPSDVWNNTMRDGDRSLADAWGFCCAHCFMHLTDAQIGTQSWLVLPFDDGPVNRAEQITFWRDEGE